MALAFGAVTMFLISVTSFVDLLLGSGGGSDFVHQLGVLVQLFGLSDVGNDTVHKGLDHLPFRGSRFSHWILTILLQGFDICF